MAYNVYPTSALGVNVSVWEPYKPDNTKTAFVVGRSSFEWYGTAASRIPRALTSAGYRAVCFDTPNWGSSVDIGLINSVLLYAVTQGWSIERLLVVGYGRGGTAVLNWAPRALDVVASVAIVSGIVDLEEHYTRVVLDRPSMEAAYGGSQATFNAAMATWNPVAGDTRAWGRRVLEQFGGGIQRLPRLTLWWSSGDVNTPPAANLALSSFYKCDTGALAAPDPAPAEADSIVAQLVKQADSWSRASSVWQHKWHTYRRSNAQTNDWAGSDGNYRLGIPHAQYGALWTQNDFRDGTVNGDESRTGGTVRHNCAVAENLDGSLGPTIFNTDGQAPWLRPADHPSGFYWVNGGVVEGGVVHYVCLHLSGGGINIDNIHIVTVSLTTLQQTGITVKGWTTRSWAYCWQSPTYTYITGGYTSGFLAGRTVLARAPLNAFTGPWQYWDGDSWSGNELDARPLRDMDGNELPLSGASLHKVKNGPWVMCSLESGVHDTVHIYASRWGPYQPDSWVHYKDVKCDPYIGLTIQGQWSFLYGADEFYPGEDSELVMAYQINFAAAGTIDSGAYMPQYFSVAAPDRNFPEL